MSATTASSEPIFELTPGINITTLPLTPEEGFVLSRFAGRMTAGELMSMTGLTSAKLKGALDKLMRIGAVTMLSTSSKASSERSGPVRPAKDPYAGVVFSPADMADGNDLTETQKKRILLFDMNLSTWSHYKLLEIKRSALAGDIKAGYFKASKEFHPDTFFRKDIGAYAGRVDRIFRAMKAAYDTLSRPTTKAAYDETLVGELTDEELEELSLIADVKRREAERQLRLKRNESARKAGRLRWNPLAQKLAKARELFGLAETAEKDGRLDEAANHARLACSYDESLRVRCEPIWLRAGMVRAAALVRKANAALDYGERGIEEDLYKALQQAYDVVEASRDTGAILDVAKLAVRLKRSQHAFKLGTLVTEIDERSIAGWSTVAEAAVAEEKWALALRAAERWLALEAGSVRAKDILKQAKAGRRA